MKMSLQSDFENIWKSVKSVIRGKLIREQEETNAVTLKNANKAWYHEKQNWQDPMQIQYNFLRSVEKKNPECARQIKDAVDQFSFHKVKLAELPSTVPYFTGTIVSTSIGTGIGYFLPDSSFIVNLIGRTPTLILGGMLFTLLGGNIMYSLWKNKSIEARNNSADLYAAQLEPLRQTLLELCQKADME